LYRYIEARTRLYRRQLENEAMDVRHHTLGGEGGYEETFQHHMEPPHEGALPMPGALPVERTPGDEFAASYAHVAGGGALRSIASGRSAMSGASAATSHQQQTLRGGADGGASNKKSHKKTNNRQKGVKLASFLPPVERAGHAAAVGGLVRAKDESDKVVHARELRGLAAAFGGIGGGGGGGGGGSGGGLLGGLFGGGGGGGSGGGGGGGGTLGSGGGGGGGGGGKSFLPGIIDEARKTRIASGRKTLNLASLNLTNQSKGHPQADLDAEVKQLDWFEEVGLCTS
jgi:hypothetical protein